MAPSPASPARLGGRADATDEVRRSGHGPAQWRHGWWRVPVLLALATALARAANVAGFAVADRVPVHQVDPDGVWAAITVHHLVQLLLVLVGLAAVTLTGRCRFADFGFTGRQWRWSLRWTVLVALAWAVIQISVGYLLVSHGQGNADPGYPLTGGNIAGCVTFEALSGVSEEPMYRGMAMSMLIAGWARLFRQRRSLAIATVVGSTVVFMIDHIGVHSLTINPLQEATVLVFGVVYGTMFWRTRSLVGPVVTHGLANVVITGSGYWLFRCV